MVYEANEEPIHNENASIAIYYAGGNLANLDIHE